MKRSSLHRENKYAKGHLAEFGNNLRFFLHRKDLPQSFVPAFAGADSGQIVQAEKPCLQMN